MLMIQLLTTLHKYIVVVCFFEYMYIVWLYFLKKMY